MNRHQRRAMAATTRHEPQKSSAPPKVLICVPSGMTHMADTSMCLGALMAASAPYVALAPHNPKGSYIGLNRNLCVYTGLYRWDADWLFWLDSDNVVPPETLITLLNHNLDIVGCDYRKRLAPYERLGAFLDDPGENGTGLHEMTRMPHGVLLVRAEVYRKMPWPWYREIYYDPATEGHLMHSDPGGLKSGEDTLFTKEARDAGFRVWCDMDLTKRVSHIGERGVGYVMGGGRP